MYKFQKLWKQISKLVGVEIISIFLTAVTGFLMLRQLPKDVYGVYSFLVLGINLIVGLSEIGMNHCFLPLVGYKNVSVEKVVAVQSIFKERRLRLFLFSLLLVSPCTLYLGYKKGWLELIYFLGFVCLLLGAYFTINEQLNRQKFIALHLSEIITKSTFISTITRTILVLSSLYVMNDSLAFIVLSCSAGIGSFAGIWVYDKAKIEKSTNNYHYDSNLLKIELEKLYKPLRIPALFYILYSNFGGYLIGWFANINIVADVNASGRLAMFLLIIDRISGVFVMPRLAQATSLQRYFKMVFFCLVIYLFIVLFVILSAWKFPEAWLLLIGDKYYNLKNILWLSFLGSIISNFSGFIFTCLTSRGYTSNQMTILICSTIVQLLAIYYLGMNNAFSIFIVSALTASVLAIGQIVILLLKVREYLLLNKKEVKLTSH